MINLCVQQMMEQLFLEWPSLQYVSQNSRRQCLNYGVQHDRVLMVVLWSCLQCWMLNWHEARNVLKNFGVYQDVHQPIHLNNVAVDSLIQNYCNCFLYYYQHAADAVFQSSYSIYVMLLQRKHNGTVCIKWTSIWHFKFEQKSYIKWNMQND